MIVTSWSCNKATWIICIWISIKKKKKITVCKFYFKMIVQKFQTIEFQISKFYNLLQKSKTHFLTFFQNNLSILTNLCNQKNFIRKTKNIPNFFTIPSLIINPNSPFQLIIRQNQSSKSSKSKNQNPERELTSKSFRIVPVKPDDSSMSRCEITSKPSRWKEK